jgi:hypothetical protein
VSADLKARMDFFAEMLRNGNFSRSALSAAFILLYCHLNSRTGRCDPSISTLAAETGMTTRSVKSAIDQLKRSGWWRISREGARGRGGRTNAYAPQFEVVKKTSPVEIEGGEAHDTTSTPKLVKRATLLRPESGEDLRQKVVKHASPKPVKNQEVRLSLGVREVINGAAGRSAFDDFWQAYPSRSPHPNPKEPARLKFEAAVKLGTDPADIIRGALNFAGSVRALGTEQRYIAQATTWLHQKRWGDYQEAPAPELPRAGMI